jgi:tetratricopeptide (TPR) repeat protein
VRSSSPEPPDLNPVKTYNGNADAAVSPVHPASSLTVVLLVDTMSPEALDGLKQDLVSAYGSLRGRNLRLAIVQNNSLEVVGPLLGRLRLQNALKEVQPLTANAPPASSAAILDLLSTNVAQLGSKWSQVVLIGDFPSLEPSTLQYASAVLLRAFNSEQVQVTWFPITKGDDAWLPLFKSTGGTIVHGGLEEIFPPPHGTPDKFFLVEWTPAPPSAGFVVFPAFVSDRQGSIQLEAPDLAVRATAPLPSIEHFAGLESQVAGVAALLSAPQPSEPEARRIREVLGAAFEMNPLDLAALRVAITFYERSSDFSSVAKYAQSLVEARPEEGTAYAALGHALLRTNDLDKADAALERAAALHVQTAQVAEDRGRVRLERKDDKGAMPYLGEALRLDPARQELWFEQAHAAERLRDSGLAIESFEKGLALAGSHVPESLALLRLYLASKQSAKALDFTARLTKELPPDPAIRSQFASGLDELRQPSQALSAWRRVLEVQPDSEPAHYRIARLLFESGDAKGAEEAADKGLEAVPKSPRLYVVEAEALEKQGHRYRAREALRKGASVAPDPDLLSRLAAVEDTYGNGAAEAYARLADALGAASAERLQALERGFAVSVRDGDLKRAASFAASLESSGRPEFAQLLGEEKQAASGTTVLGGLDALAFAVHAKNQISPERFFVEYSRTLLDAARLSFADYKNPLPAQIEKHFQTIATLEAMGKRNGDRVVIELSVNAKKSRKNTEEVLRVFGIKLHAGKGEVTVKRGEKKSQALKQETASALAVDEVGMQETLEEGKPYDLEIRDEWAPVYPDEKLWREAFYAKEKDPGGLALALARLPKMAELYVGMSSLDRKVIDVLLGSVPLRTLYDKYSRLVYLYGPALAMNGDHAAVPGGAHAEPVWAQLVGVSPGDPGSFFRALLERDEGKMLSYFFALSGLDPAHQAFFEASASRTREFYKLFARSEEMHHVSALGIRAPLSGFFRSVPLDSEGHLDFPGSPELWALAAGRSSSQMHIEKLLKQVAKTAPPEVEDSVLLRLAETHYHDVHTGQHTELENFLAVSRIDAHRPEPLDERSALILAQRYDENAGVYPYFTDLTTLGAADFTQFFSAVDRFKSHQVVAANFQLGELNALIEWICLMRRRQTIGDDTARKLFQYVCERFNSAADDLAYARASLESARAILAACNLGKGRASPDDQIRACVLGAHGAEVSSVRGKEFQGVLDRQNAPRLETLFSVFDAANKLSGGGSMREEVSTLRTGVAGLPRIELTKEMKALGKEKDALAGYGLAVAGKRVEEIGQKASKRKPNRKAIQKLSEELLAQLQPHITAALAGPIYAYFLRPTDLVVSEDALLLRKHRYVDFVGPEGLHGPLNTESRFVPESRGTGSYFEGSFALFGVAAGEAAMVGWKMGGGSAGAAAAAQIAALRSTIWDSLEEADQRLLCLRIAIAREWIFESARVPDAFRALSDETIGLLSLSRRADLLNGIKARDWRKAQEAVTLADLLALGGKYLDHFKSDPWPSPVDVELREVAASNDGSHLSLLGPLRNQVFGCSHPHLLPDAPYEEYERHLFPSDIAQRTAEFKLFLASLADSVGVEPIDLANVAEPLAAKAFGAAQMTDPHDWRSLLAAYASVSARDLETALQP